MNENPPRWCVLLPCSNDEKWAVPQNCLAEIVTVSAVAEEPPEEIIWRGQAVPVLNLDHRHEAPWRDQRAKTGLIAVMLGLRNGSWEYCGVALRGAGLGMKDLSVESIEDVPEMAMESSVSAFRMGGEVYQVPKLDELTCRLSAESLATQSA